MKNIFRYFSRLSKIGAKNKATYIEIKRIQMVNIIAMICIIPAFLFSIINFYENRFLLSLINFLNSLSYLIVILLHHYGKINTAKVLVVTSNFLLFFVSALIYRNGGEYFLISVIIISMLIYDNIKKLVVWGLIIVCAIMIIYAFPNIKLGENPVPYGRALYNIVSSLIFCVIALVFFKHVNHHDKNLIELQRQKLDKLNQEKEKIFSIIAHDLRTPLNNASSLLEAFQSNSLSHVELNAFINSIKQQINHQNRVIENILEWSSRKMMGESNIFSDISINKAIRSLLDNFDIPLKNKNIVVRCSIAANIFITADPDHIKIIFRNILSNAIKFSYPNGEINIFSTTENNLVHITIQDNGVGIPASMINAISNKVQKRSSGTNNEPGSGLGLVLCKELIDLNQGSLNISSTPELGTLFTVTFPLMHPSKPHEFTLIKDNIR